MKCLYINPNINEFAQSIKLLQIKSFCLIGLINFPCLFSLRKSFEIHAQIRLNHSFRHVDC